MRVLITGGTGLIGRAVAASLVQDDHEVIVLSRSPERITSLPAGVQVVGWNARTTEGWGHLADGAGAIVNLAGVSLSGEGFFPRRWTPERKRLIRESRLNAARAVVEAVEQARHKPRVLIQASGVGYYGHRGDQIVTEETPPGDDFIARFASEEWEPSTQRVEVLGVRRAIIRSGVVLSPESPALKPMLLQFRLFLGGPIGTGKQWFSWIHVQDEAAAIRFLIEQETAHGPFNLVAPHPVTNADLARALGRVLGRPSFLPVPGFAMRLAFGEVADLLLTGQRANPQRLVNLGFSFRFPEVEEALRDLLS